MNILKYKKFYYLISAFIILPGLISLVFFGLKPAIDFTGGSEIVMQIQSDKAVSPKEIEKIIETQGYGVQTISKGQNGVFMIRTQPLSENIPKQVKNHLKQLVQRLGKRQQ